MKHKPSFSPQVVDNGLSLRQNVMDLTNHLDSANYKIRPIRRKIRELLSLRFRQHVSSATLVELWLGISTDEARRIRNSRDRWIVIRYPLIEVGMSQ